MGGILSFPKIFISCVIVLFLGIGIAGVVKKKSKEGEVVSVQELVVQEEQTQEKNSELLQVTNVCEEKKKTKDRIRLFFSRGMDKLPIVETITYTSRVSWLKGRPAWIADYASHFETSRHFIARSLNGRPDYLSQRVAPGDKFNVFRLDKNINFYLLVDLKACSMDFYYLDYDNDERVFIKSYPIGVGRLDDYSPSGSLTPIGKYSLGGKVAIYKPGVEHYFQNQKTHMIEVFGTRWLPFERELENCSDSAKGYGIHGVPCNYEPETEVLSEMENILGTYTSDGCIRLKKDDIEELFSIVITKPTIVEIVKNKSEAVLPMAKENNLE